MFQSVVSFVHDADRHIQRPRHKVENVQPQNVSQVSRRNFACDAADISHDNNRRKHQAFAFRRFGFYTFNHGYRPRDAKANKHQNFKNLSHKICLLLFVQQHFTLDK